MFKVNNKDTGRRSGVEFEQVNADWGMSVKLNIFFKVLVYEQLLINRKLLSNKINIYH